MFDFRQFLFRSPERDGETDRRRLAALQQAVHSAVESAVHESNGLRGRLDRARQSAAFLLAQMDDGIPEAARGGELANLERRLVGAERRLARLRIQLTILRTIEGMVVTAFEPLATGGTAARSRVGVEPNAQIRQ
jgi:nucleoid-associated protein YgaU